MRKFLLAFIACLVAVIAYASPGSPYLSYGWRPTGGGVTAPSADGTGGNAHSDVSVTTLTTSAMTTSGTADFVLCEFTVIGTYPTGITISGSAHMGAFSLLKTQQGDATHQATSSIYGSQATGALAADTVTASWTNAQVGTLYCQPYNHAANLNAKVQGTDYNVGGSYTTTGTTVSASLTVIGTNSIIFGGGNTWNQQTLTADANTTIINQAGPGFYITSSNASYNGGTHAIGGTVSASDHDLMAITEVLGQ